MNLFGSTPIPSLEKALDRADLTQRVIAQNIANVDTPGYKAKTVAFRNVLQSAFQARRTDPRHFAFSTDSDDGARVVTDWTTTIQNNGNNVDIDKEMLNLATDQIAYQAYSEAISRKFNEWNIVLKGGNG
ncbi:flagellar basal body rod protein FlgB [Caenibacillus caldisaponilyticus]|jgi:flagellar basal-body rod protein FlgB|uniref:flagellar basal body rod protein FlgB n=1 Tax=Caenibacillus caldisaponilyticus TaxID=1674942 RepID=UPI000988846B|nr:flagellar basal body rod protein FlgB [Caenibacillus caldisaponilyticus]